MTQKFIDQRKKDLLKKREELEKDLKSFADKSDRDDWETKYPQMADDEEESVDEVEEYENLLPIEKSLEEELKDIDNALEKIEKGEYGKCDICGKEISEERLIILPQAKTCDICKCQESECINNN